LGDWCLGPHEGFLEQSSLLPYVDAPQKMDALIKNDYAAYVPLIKRLGLKSE
jgi:hypothetical protein